MTRAELQTYLSGLSEAFVFPEEETDSQYLEVEVDRATWHELALKIRDDEKTKFDYLFCLTGVDWKTNMSVVYHLESTTHRHILVVKVYTEDRENPSLDSVFDVWVTADMHEREVFDLFGIDFNNHPNMKRILLTEDWEGHPMRKDYVDEANMIIRK